MLLNINLAYIIDCELPKATSTSALSSAGVMRLFNKVGETVNKITYKMDENEPVIKIIYLFKLFLTKIFIIVV